MFRNSAMIQLLGLELAKKIEHLRPQIEAVLCRIESPGTVQHEIERSRVCLENIFWEAFDLSSVAVEQTASYLPQNLPLYSYVLFCVIPSWGSQKLYARPPVVLRQVLGELHNLLSSPDSNIYLHMGTRRSFLEAYVSGCDVVIFTGRYENAIQVCGDLAYNTLFLFNGYGPNPFVIGADADIEHAAAKAIEARTFNSGQDCAGPDVFFVAHESYNEFLEKLCLSCESIPVGDYSDSSSVAVGPLIDQVTYNSIAKLLADSEYEVLSGGRCDSRKRMVYPTVVRPSGDNNYQPPPEWFSPVFNIVPYACKDELESFFLSDYYREHAMYLSSFGSMPISSHSLGKTQILKCKTVIDIERGNLPFGGYGIRASHVRYRNRSNPRPVLISREMARAHQNR